MCLRLGLSAFWQKASAAALQLFAERDECCVRVGNSIAAAAGAGAAGSTMAGSATATGAGNASAGTDAALARMARRLRFVDDIDSPPSCV